MSPTLHDGQWALVLKGTERVKLGDVALFINPVSQRLTVKRYIMNRKESPNIQHGWLITPWGRWYLSGEQRRPTDSLPAPQKNLMKDALFLVGDNQFHSFDSRDYGYVSRSNVLGRVLIREH